MCTCVLTGKPVEEIMGAWTRQTGYPVLHVSVKVRRFLSPCIIAAMLQYTPVQYALASMYPV